MAATMNETLTLNKPKLNNTLVRLIAWRLLWANSVAGGGGGDPSL
jgi:hypothetical protein